MAIVARRYRISGRRGLLVTLGQQVGDRGGESKGRRVASLAAAAERRRHSKSTDDRFGTAGAFHWLPNRQREKQRPAACVYLLYIKRTGDSSGFLALAAQGEKEETAQ